MMRLLMHSMACPNIEPEAAFALAHELELDGIELICQADYRCAIAPDAPLGEARRLAAAARDAGSRVATLTPYTKGMNSPDAEERSKAVRELEHCVSLAAELGARIVRVFGGAEVPAQEEDAARQRLAGSLRPIGDQAQALGLTLCIENHMDTMATSAGATMAIVDLIDHPAFGVLYDQPNLDFMRAEPFPESFELQAARIRHVHVKDFRWSAAGEREPALLGEGIVPWRAILAGLVGNGYAGFLTLEYEKRWYPRELPEARIGVAAGRDHLRALLANIAAELR